MPPAGVDALTRARIRAHAAKSCGSTCRSPQWGGGGGFRVELFLRTKNPRGFGRTLYSCPKFPSSGAPSGRPHSLRLALPCRRHRARQRGKGRGAAVLRRAWRIPALGGAGVQLAVVVDKVGPREEGERLGVERGGLGRRAPAVGRKRVCEVP